jgi:UTP--glucose-1-phosphate uridylyltransferase
MQKSANDLKFMPAFVAKMEAAGLHSVVINAFVYYYKKVVGGETGLIPGSQIESVATDDIEHADRIKNYVDHGNRVLKNSIIIKLNGGLGTSMGLTGAKSLLEVKNGKSFLEIMLMQAAVNHVQLAFMNSYNTHDDTLSALSRFKPSPFPLVFLQNKFPKVLQKSFEPANWPENPDLEWNPPGHGDIYSALYTSGILETLLGKGIIYAFISNSDNLGATMDSALLGYFAANKFPFMMEVARRTPSDVKGGHLARHKNGRLILREAAQCPKDELEAFSDINRYGFFNTNNIWINLEVLKKVIKKHGSLKLPLILNPKTLDPRDENSPAVFQIETAMGAAISLFEGAGAIQVPFSRFFPVKKCNDLLSIRSDRFLFSEDNHLILNPKVVSSEIDIDLEPKYFGKIDNFNQRFADPVPSLIECESIKVRGDVLFENNVSIKGRVVIQNFGKTQRVVREGTVVDSDLIFN